MHNSHKYWQGRYFQIILLIENEYKSITVEIKHEEMSSLTGRPTTRTFLLIDDQKYKGICDDIYKRQLCFYISSKI